MKQISIFTTVSKLALVSTVALLVACSGSSDSSVSAATTPDGYVVAAPVSGASVVVKDAAGNTVAGPATTASDGSYNIDPGSASSGIYILESSGGTYTDEATLKSTTAGTLMAYVDGANLAVGSQVQVTAASTIVYEMVVNHGIALDVALKAFEAAFGFAADSVVAPADATNPAADATNEELLASLHMAAFSQLTKNLNLDPAQQFDLLAALAEDLADGSLNGMKGASPVSITPTVMLPVDIHNLFSQAFVDFHASLNDKTGLDNDMIGGTLPFAKVALTNSYKIEYVTEAMPMMGKTDFTLRISNIGGGVPATLPVTMMPMMHMPEDRNHSTPKLGCTENAITPGDYDCTLYYLMPSDSRGYWELTVMAGMGESATFYPQVMMDMGARVVLKDLNDGNDATMEHNYFLFKENLADTKDEFTIFLAYMKTMMEIPAVGTTLNAMPVIVQFSTVESPDAAELPAANVDWIDADGITDDGFWVAPITGFAGKIHVRLFIDGVLKSTDGNALGATVDPDTKEYVVNEYATFMFMPMTMPRGM